MKTMRFAMAGALAALIILVAVVAPGSPLATKHNPHTASIMSAVDNNTVAGVPDDVRKAVEKNLVEPLRKKYYGTKDLDKDMMSRCPSGIHSGLTAYTADEAGYYFGTIKKWSGCSSKELCKFRATAKAVEVKSLEGYIPAADWLNSSAAKQTKKEI